MVCFVGFSIIFLMAMGEKNVQAFDISTHVDAEGPQYNFSCEMLPNRIQSFLWPNNNERNEALQSMVCPIRAISVLSLIDSKWHISHTRYKTFYWLYCNGWWSLMSDITIYRKHEVIESRMRVFFYKIFLKNVNNLILVINVACFKKHRLF